MLSHEGTDSLMLCCNNRRLPEVLGDSAGSETGPAAELADWSLANELYLMNRKNARTRLGKAGQRDSIIDLTFSSHTGVKESQFQLL